MIPSPSLKAHVFFGVQAAVVRCCEDVQYKTLADCVCFGMNSAAPCMETTLPRTCDPSPSAISGDNYTLMELQAAGLPVLAPVLDKFSMAFLDNWNQLDVRLKACHQSEIAWRAFKGSEKKTAQLQPLAIFLTDWDSSLSSQNKSSHSIWRVFVNLLSGATGPACCAVAEGKKNQFASPICCCFQIHLAATVLMRPRVLSWTHPPLSRQSAIPLHFTCPAQWPADRRCGGGSVGDPIDSCRPCRWKFLDSSICLGVLRGMAMRVLASRTSELPGDLWLWNKRTRPLTCDSKRAQCALCICMICLKCLPFWGSAAVHWPLATLTVPWYIIWGWGWRTPGATKEYLGVNRVSKFQTCPKDSNKRLRWDWFARVAAV